MVLTGSCPWPEPWFRTHGAHLHLQAREDPIPTAEAVPPALPMNLLLEKTGNAFARAAMPRGAGPCAAGFWAADCGSYRRIADHQDARVSGYRALAEEADPSWLLSALQASGCEICYPRVHMKGQPLWFHVPVANEPWVPGAFGIPEPRADWPRAFPSVFLVPLLAFDARGYRLGYGGGYYDRTLAQFRHERGVMAVGIAFGGQEVPSVPHDSSDEKTRYGSNGGWRQAFSRTMRILFIGDIVGRPGREVVTTQVPVLRENLQIDFVVANGENAAGGFGLTRAIANEFFACGVDCITTGNHWADQKEILSFIGDEDRILRPRNLPAGTPGKGANLYQTRYGQHVLVVNPLGRVFMEPQDDPFAAVEVELSACPLGEAADAIVVDMHAEATSEKMAMGHFCDGRASLVVGTHSHVPTADAQILARRHRLSDRRGRLRRLRFGHRHGKIRAAAALHTQDAQQPLLAAPRPGHAVRRVRRDKRQGSGRRASSRCGWADV